MIPAKYQYLLNMPTYIELLFLVKKGHKNVWYVVHIDEWPDSK